MCFWENVNQPTTISPTTIAYYDCSPTTSSPNDYLTWPNQPTQPAGLGSGEHALGGAGWVRLG